VTLINRIALANGWTGGQWSVVRGALGLSLALHLGSLFTRERELDALGPPWFVVTLLLAAVAASILLILGSHDRPAAVFLALAWTFLGWGVPSPAWAALPIVGFLLLTHACLPPAPFGSLAARGRPDPNGGWRFPPVLFAAAWIFMILGYAYLGLGQITGLFERDGGLAAWVASWLWVLSAPAVLVRRLRAWLWLALLLLLLPLLVLADLRALYLSLTMLHLFTFDPAWVKSKGGGVERLFYDGSCALCHGAVRFVLAEDPEGKAFRFAPLDSDSFRGLGAAPGSLPDSLVVATADGRLLTRSAGVLRILERLGGLWRILAVLGRALPRPPGDAAYDLVARIRYRVFGRKSEACPLIPPALRGRFDL
jgi:predicted DCC family thiol-disulfide oxidoreductase YuxK